MAKSKELNNYMIKQINDALQKQISYKLTNQNEDAGLCKCGRITEIIDGEFYCKYCGQKITK